MGANCSISRGLRHAMKKAGERGIFFQDPRSRFLRLRFFQRAKRLENKAFLQSAREKARHLDPSWGTRGRVFAEKFALSGLKKAQPQNSRFGLA